MADLQQVLDDLQALLGTSHLCAWHSEDGLLVQPVRTAPHDWLEAEQLLPDSAADSVLTTDPDAACALLPASLRQAATTSGIAAVLRARRTLAPGHVVGLFGVWDVGGHVPAAAEAMAGTILAAVGHLLWGAGPTGDVVKDSPQVRALAAALPQGIVLVPADSDTGFVNAAAASLLDVAPGEVEAGQLARSLRSLIRRARDPEAIAAFAARVLAGADVRPDERTTVWRFDSSPQALRVTLSPIRTSRTAGWVWLLEDISRETLLQDELADSEQKFRSFHHTLWDPVVFYDLQGRPQECNDALFRLLQTQIPDVTCLTAADLGWTADEWAAVSAACQSTGVSALRERKVVAAGGAAVHVESSAYLRRGPDGQPRGIWEVMRDVTERKNAEAQLILSAEAFARNTEGVILTDADQVILTVNDAFCRASGYRREDLRGKTPALLKSGRHDAPFYEQMRRSINNNGWWQGGIWNRNRDGQLFFKWLTVNAVRDERGVLTHFVGVYRDAVAVRAAKRQIEYLATHDGLTRLPNAVLFEDRLRHVVERSSRARILLGVVIVELLGIERINGAMGTAAGDAVIRGAGERLREASRESPVVARLSGDRFGALVEADSAEGLAQYATRLLAALNAPYDFAGVSIAAPACAGISTFPGDGDTAQALLFNARAALQHAKGAGTHGMQFFAAEMSRELNQYFLLETGLRQALEHGELRLAYQAQVSAKDGRVTGCEALLRWQRGDRLESPAEFLPVAESANLIVPITEWVLRQACRDLCSWDAQGVVIPAVSINVSARHFQFDDMVVRLRDIVHDEGVAPGRICLEITEGALASPERSEAKVEALKTAGFLLSLDDFGTGFSSLSYLRRFRLDELKIDRSFVRGIEEDRSDRALVDAILSMAHGLGLSVVAEGVETRDQVDYLVARGCERLQGYLYMRPADASALLAFARTR